MEDAAWEGEEMRWRSSSLVAASVRSSSSGFFPGPRKPMPPALETAVARAGPLKMRMGALTIRGVVIQG